MYAPEKVTFGWTEFRGGGQLRRFHARPRIMSPLERGDDNVWIRSAWYHSDYRLDSLARKESALVEEQALSRNL
jgi:hypothetical protein